MNAFNCGLDIHKETTYATVLDEDGEAVTQKRMRDEEIPGFLEPYARRCCGGDPFDKPTPWLKKSPAP